jgi:hypothetical protein
MLASVIAERESKATVRFGLWAAFWGDTSRAARPLLDDGVDYLVADYLAEITMALLARARAKGSDAGYVPDVVGSLKPLLADLARTGTKVVTNGGALNPRECARVLQEAADAADLPLRVAAIEGDDLSLRIDEILATQPKEMSTGEDIPPDLASANAYIGARPIARALDMGADIVVTGRCADSSLVVGPLMHEFGWSDTDYDRLASGTLAGHIIECGPQSIGGVFTDWYAVPGWDDMGYPIVEVSQDGTSVVTKPAATGGLVSVGTVGEQILFEIGDPAAFITPDVVCDWRNVKLEQVGPDRVQVSGAKGNPATKSYKVLATHHGGFRVLATAMFAGIDAAGRARRAGEALVVRTERLVAEEGFKPLIESSVEVVGAGDILGGAGRPDEATEVVLKVGVRHRERAALEIFAAEFVPFGVVAQGMAGVFAGRPRVAPVYSVLQWLLDKGNVSVSVHLEGSDTPVAVSPGSVDAPAANPPLSEDVATTPPAGRTVPLRALAYARSGDKGDGANIGLMARHPDFLAIIREQVTAERVRSIFSHYHPREIRRWELPGLNAINIVIDGVLGGQGGTSTLRYDPQGKSYGAMLLTLPVVIPSDRHHERLLTESTTPIWYDT